ncbi:MAG: T9SS type A sorting domain-containing protein [Bacteroidia bacterium]|nr:T9SS type A sorting domain-containing protein [Bacteroidia bacterium]
MKTTISAFFLVLFQTLSSQQWFSVNNNNTDTYPSCLGVFSGKLTAAGYFSQIGGVNASRVACYNGNWAAMGTGTTSGIPLAMTEYNGELYAGGNFIDMGGAPSTIIIARWDGSQWKTAGNAQASGWVYSLCVYNGELYAGGDFTVMGGVPCNRIAKWNGTNWSAVGSGVTGSIPTVYAMSVYNGKLYVGGMFNNAGGVTAYNIARWDGMQWDSVAAGLTGAVGAMVADTIRNFLYAGGGFGASGVTPLLGVGAWNDTIWSAMGTDSVPAGESLEMYNGDLYASGVAGWTIYNGDTIKFLAKWDGNDWSSVSDFNATILDIKAFSGNLYVVGGFTQVDTSTIKYIACMGPNCLTVGINNLNEDTISWNIFPNPSAEEITITYSAIKIQDSKARLMNNLGQTMKVIKLEEGSEEMNIKVSDLSPGIYFVCMEQEDVITKSKKLIIVR